MGDCDDDGGGGSDDSDSSDDEDWDIWYGKGGGGGGGNSGRYPGIPDFTPKDVLHDYTQGWTYFDHSWSTLTNPNASGYSIAVAVSYMTAWGGAHGLLGLGAALLACNVAGPGCVTAAESLLGIGATASADGDPTNEITAITSYYPPNQGFSGEPVETLLSKGDILSRYGTPDGRFFSPAGVPTWARSLPPGATNSPEQLFRVIKPFTVYSGQTSPWFGQPGGGLQYYSILTQQSLLDYGYIAPVVMP